MKDGMATILLVNKSLAFALCISSRQKTSTSIIKDPYAGNKRPIYPTALPAANPPLYEKTTATEFKIGMIKLGINTDFELFIKAEMTIPIKA